MGDAGRLLLELPSLRRSWYSFSFLIDELGTAVTSDSPWIAGRMPRTAFGFG